MAFKPSTWYPIAVVLSVVNLAGAGFALGQAQPEHAAIHVALAVAFGLWARRLRPRPGGNELPGGSELQNRLKPWKAKGANRDKDRPKRRSAPNSSKGLLAGGGVRAPWAHSKRPEREKPPQGPKTGK